MGNQRIICHSIIDFPGVEAYQVKFHLWRSSWSDSVSDVVIFIRLCDMEMWWLVFISPPYYLRLNVQSLMVHSTLSMLCKFLLSLSWILEASAFIRWSNHVEMEEAQNLGKGSNRRKKKFEKSHLLNDAKMQRKNFWGGGDKTFQSIFTFSTVFFSQVQNTDLKRYRKNG